MQKVIEAPKVFTVNIKEVVSIYVTSSIKFLKKEVKVPHKRSPPVRILHHASDYVLLADCFPVRIAFTQLRSDFTIFSNSLRNILLIEVR